MSKKATLHVQHTFAIKTKTESGNCLCIRVVYSIKQGLIVMSTNFGIQRNRETQKKEKVGFRPAKLNEKKSVRQRLY